MIAIVYDNLNTKYGGAEVVLKALLDTFPSAQLYSTVSTLGKDSWLGDRPVQTSFLQKLPGFLRRRHQLQAVLAPVAIESLAVTEPVVISITAGAAKGIITRPDQTHICYLLTPTRYLYDSDEALKSAGLASVPIINWFAKKALNYLRWWDFAAAQRPDLYVTLSDLVTQRLKAVYNREADAVIPPPFVPEPVTIPLDLMSIELPDFLFSVGRQVWYKRIDVLVEYARAARAPVIIAGEGASAKEWQRRAGDDAVIRQKKEPLKSALQRWNPKLQPIVFVNTITKAEEVFLFKKAKAFVMPGLEDFGLTALEALYYGAPVIVHRQSGVAEVLTNKVAQFLADSTVLELTQAIGNLKSMSSSQTLLKAHAVRYSEAEFKRKFAQYVQKRSFYGRA